MINEALKLDIPPSPAPICDVPEMTRGEKRGLVGFRYSDTAIVAWNLLNNKNIEVDARKISESAWIIDGRAAGTLRITATVYGGKNATIKYVRFIRNALMSRVNRRRHRPDAQEGEVRDAAL